MFGYINVNRKEMSEEDIKIYQAYYCGLCQRLRVISGKKGQLLLNYDMTFLVVLLTGLYEPDDEEKLYKCKVHPMKKRNIRMNDISDYAATMNILLAYHNLRDDWNDDKNPVKFTMARAIYKDYNSMSLKYPRQAKAIEKYMEKLAEYEKCGETNIDLVAGLTGDMLGEIFAWKQDEWYDELKNLGYYLGKFIYLMDAYEDIEKDECRNRYNPLRNLKNENGENFETLCRLMMTSMMSECAKSFERLPILMHADILRNILYSGVWTRYEFLQIKKKRAKK